MSAVVRWFASRSLRAKLLWTNIAVVIPSLLTVMVIVAGSEWHHAKTTLLDDTRMQAQVLAGATSATLVFDDPAAAREILGTLSLFPHLREAVVFRADGTEFARYRRTGASPATALEFPARADSYAFRESVLDVAQPIGFERDVVGYIVLRAGLDAARERLHWIALASGIAAVVALVVASLLAWRMREVVVGPIRRLAQVTREISEIGDYGRRAEVESRDEVGVLARDFNSMIEQIERRNDALQESEARFRLMADCAPVLIWVAGLDRLYNWFNRPWLAFTGRTMHQELGNGWAEGVHPDDFERYLRAYAEAFERRAKFAVEYRLRRCDGEYRWMIDQGVPRFEADGKFDGYVGACIDITEKKQATQAVERINAELERRVQERTAELVAANRELEGFTFATSHDLRGPLGRINSFSALLEQKYADRIDGDGLLFLSFIRQNAIRLTQLVNDLLKHARMTQQPVELGPVDPSELAQAVLLEKVEDFRAAGARIEFDMPFGKVLGDSVALTQVLDNLLGNALKYSSPARPPLIVIGGRIAGDRFRLWVRDNGIGFDMAYHGKIFEIFHRLHSHSEYEGSGIGLALVKRAMERMGGKVWAESQPDRGATFFLELQLAEATETLAASLKAAA